MDETMEKSLTYEEARDLYFTSDNPDIYDSPPLGERLIPSHGGSTRTDADDGWHLRNINGWLATVYDDGQITASVADTVDDPDLESERQRGTTSEQPETDD